MRIALIVVGVLVLAVVGLFGWRSYATQNVMVPGFSGSLRPCPDTPNCVVSTAATSSQSAIEALMGGDADSWTRVQEAITATGGELRKVEQDYLWATYTSTVFRFVDDVEMHRRPGDDRIEVRSASRTGYSDLGANRKRIEAIRSQHGG